MKLTLALRFLLASTMCRRNRMVRDLLRHASCTALADPPLLYVGELESRRHRTLSRALMSPMNPSGQVDQRQAVARVLLRIDPKDDSRRFELTMRSRLGLVAALDRLRELDSSAAVSIGYRPPR